MDEKEILIDNLREGLRNIQRYINISLGASVAALFIALFNEKEPIELFGVHVPASAAYWLFLIGFWGTGFMSLQTITRSTKSLVSFSQLQNLLSAAIDLPIFITSHNLLWRYTPTIMAPVIAFISLLVNEGFPTGLNAWFGFIVTALVFCLPFIRTITLLRKFHKSIYSIVNG